MNTDTQEMLVSLLAMERSLFRPFRQRDWVTNGRGRGSSTRHQLQREYRKIGLRLPGAGNAAERKIRERLLADMTDDDLVVSAGANRQTHWKLTVPAREIAAALAGQPQITVGRQFVLDLLKYAPPGKLVSELLLAGLDNYSEDAAKQLFDSTTEAIPALVEGWIETASDTYGRSAYWTTPSGETAAREPAPALPDDLPEPSESLTDLYWNVYDAEVERLARIATPDARDCAPLPLSVGLFCNIAGPWNRKSEQ